MNGSGADAFASGFARGFGVINDFYERKENRKLKKEQLQMQREKHQWDKEFRDKELGFKGTQLEANIKHQDESRDIQREGNEIRREQVSNTAAYQDRSLDIREGEAASTAQYRQGMLGIERTKAANYNKNLNLQNKKLNHEISAQERVRRAQYFQGKLHEYENSDAEGKKRIQQELIDGLNATHGDVIGEGKRLTSIEMVGDRSPEQGDKIVLGVESDQSDGSTTQSYISQNRSADPNDPYIALEGGQFIDALVNSPNGGNLIAYMEGQIKGNGGTLGERYGEPEAHGSIVFQREKSTNKGHKLGEDKTVTAGINGALKPVDLDRSRKAMEKTTAIVLGGYDNLTDSISYESDDRRAEHSRIYNTSSAIWDATGRRLDERMIVHAVARGGQGMSDEEAYKLAKEELANREGRSIGDRIFGDNKDAIRARAAQIKTESAGVAEVVMQELAKMQQNPFHLYQNPGQTGGVQQAAPARQQAPRQPMTAPEWDQIKPEDQQKMLNNARKDEAYRARFIELFGDNVWQANN